MHVFMSSSDWQDVYCCYLQRARHSVPGLAVMLALQHMHALDLANNIYDEEAPAHHCFMGCCGISSEQCSSIFKTRLLQSDM